MMEKVVQKPAELLLLYVCVLSEDNIEAYAHTLAYASLGWMMSLSLFGAICYVLPHNVQWFIELRVTSIICGAYELFNSEVQNNFFENILLCV